MNTSQKKEKIKIWHAQQEKILKVWGEQSSCYRYMHFKSYQKYKKLSMRFTLPIIIISTITGTANFAQESFPPSWQRYVPSGIGAFNLVAAIMTTILQFLKINELMESHRVSSILYGKLSRSIRLQLTLPRTERSQDGASFIEYCNNEYDRLIEQSPSIPRKIIKLFEKEFPIRKITKQRTMCIDFKKYCCEDEIDEKELPLERPEIIKLTPIKPYGFHDGTKTSHGSQTDAQPQPQSRPRFKSHPPLPITPTLTPIELEKDHPHPVAEIMKRFTQNETDPDDILENVVVDEVINTEQEPAVNVKNIAESFENRG